MSSLEGGSLLLDPAITPGGGGGPRAAGAESAPVPWDTVVRFGRDYGYPLLLAALVVTAVFLLITFVVARRRGRVDKWVATLSGYAVLALSAEGMWGVARERLRLPVVLAAAVFFVAEAAMVSSALQAARHYEATTVRDPSGRVITPGHPGKHGRAVWIIAAVAGLIVAANSKNLVEAPLRLALPLAAAMLWWNALTAEGSGRPESSSWRWTPRRFLLWIGALEPGERDMVAVDRDRRVGTMTAVAHRLHAAPEGSRGRRRAVARLRRLALEADEEMIEAVRRRVRLVHEVEALTAPQRAPVGSAPVGSALAGSVTAPAAPSATATPSGAPPVVPAELVVPAEPGRPVAPNEAAAPRPPAATADQPPAPARAERRRNGPGTPRPSDAELMPRLRELPQPVTVTAVMRELGVGANRARRLLAEAGLRAPSGTDAASPDTGSPDAASTAARPLHAVHDPAGEPRPAPPHDQPADGATAREGDRARARV